MAQDEVIQISTGNSAKSLLDLRKELKDTQVELSKTKQGTKEYQEQLEKLGAIKDDIGDLRDVIGALNPEGKVAAFSNVAGKLAGGFQAATGAAALFGGQSEELEKQLLKVQAATAFAQGIQSIIGLSDAFAALKVVLLSFNPVLLIAVAAVTAIAVAYKVWSENMSDAAVADAALNAELERQAKLQDNINAGIQRELELKKAVGLTTKETNKAELDAQIQIYAGIRTRQILLQQINDKSKEQSDELRKLDREEQDAYNKILILKISGDKKIREEEKKTREEQKQNAADRRKELEAEYAQILKNVDVNLKARQAERDRDSQMESERRAAELSGEAEYLEQDRLLKEYYLNSELEESQRSREIQDERDISASEKRKELAKQEADARTQAIQKGLSAAQQLSDLYFQNQLQNVEKGSAAELEVRKKAFNVNKAFQIANATINGAQAVLQALASLPPPYSFVVAAISGIAAAVQIAKIASTKFDAGGTSAPSAGGSISAPSVATPTAPTVQPSTNLNANGTQSTTPLVRTYVLAADVTEKQNDAKRIKTESSY